MTQQIDQLLSETDWLQKLARQLVADPDRAADLAQDAAVTTLESGTQVRGPAKPWLRSVARHRAIRQAHMEKRRAEVERDAPPTTTSPAAALAAERFELHGKVVDAVRTLPDPYREAILLRFWEDLPPREIARRLHAPVETIKTRLTRGLQMLRQRLDHAYGDRSGWLLPMSLWAPTRPAMLTIPKLVAGAACIAITTVITVTALSEAGQPAAGPLTIADTSLAEMRAPSADSGSTTATTAHTTPIRTPVPGGIEVRVFDLSNRPVANASVYWMAVPRKRTSLSQRFLQITTAPKPTDPTPYAWFGANVKNYRTDRDGIARLPKTHGKEGGIFAFTETLDGGLPIQGPVQGPVKLQLHPRRVAKVRVHGLAGGVDEVLVGFLQRGRVQHAAWTKEGLATIPLVGRASMIAMMPKAAEGEFAICLPLGGAGRTAVDLRTDPRKLFELQMPPTGRIRLECRDTKNRLVQLNGKARLFPTVDGRIAPQRLPTAEARIEGGEVTFPRVAFDQTLWLQVEVFGRESPIEMAISGPTQQERTVHVPIKITEDVAALRRAAEKQRRRAIAQQIQKDPSQPERQLIQAAIAKADTFALDVIVSRLVQHRALDRSLDALRRYQTARQEDQKRLKSLPFRPHGISSCYYGIADKAPEALVAEYRAQLNRADLWAHRSEIITAVGFFTPKSFSVDAFLSGVLRDDPNPRNRANCFFAMGSRASLGVAERSFLTAATDLRAFGAYRGMILSGLSNFSQRVPETTLARIRDALLLDKVWSAAERKKLQKIRGK